MSADYHKPGVTDSPCSSPWSVLLGCDRNPSQDWMCCLSAMTLLNLWAPWSSNPLRQSRAIQRIDSIRISVAEVIHNLPPVSPSYRLQMFLVSGLCPEDCIVRIWYATCIRHLGFQHHFVKVSRRSEKCFSHLTFYVSDSLYCCVSELWRVLSSGSESSILLPSLSHCI